MYNVHVQCTCTYYTCTCTCIYIAHTLYRYNYTCIHVQRTCLCTCTYSTQCKKWLTTREKFEEISDRIPQLRIASLDSKVTQREKKVYVLLFCCYQLVRNDTNSTMIHVQVYMYKRTIYMYMYRCKAFCKQTYCSIAQPHRTYMYMYMYVHVHVTSSSKSGGRTSWLCPSGCGE